MDTIPSQIKHLIEMSAEGNFKISSRNYPSYLDSEVNLAVDLKRSGKYIESVNLYNKILITQKTLYSEIIYFMIKVVLCAGYFKEAIILLNLGSMILKETYQPNPLTEHLKTLNPFPYNGFEEVYIKLVGMLLFETKEKTIDYLRSISGNSLYKFERDFQQAFKEVMLLDLSRMSVLKKIDLTKSLYISINKNFVK
jgi:hypothetical protein